MGGEASRTRIETRIAEVGGRLVDVRAPAHWTGARLDAWIDWAGGAADIVAAIDDYVEGLTAAAQAKGLIKDVRARTRFRDALTEALLTGVIGISPARTRMPIDVVEAGLSDAAAKLAAMLASHRGQEAAQAASLELGRRLQAVMDAVLQVAKATPTPAPIRNIIRASPAPPRAPARQARRMA